MTDRGPLRNRPNVLLFLGFARSKKDRHHYPNRPARVISLTGRLTKRSRLAAEAARLTSIEEA